MELRLPKNISELGMPELSNNYRNCREILKNQLFCNLTMTGMEHLLLYCKGKYLEEFFNNILVHIKHSSKDNFKVIFQESLEDLEILFETKLLKGLKMLLYDHTFMDFLYTLQELFEIPEGKSSENENLYEIEHYCSRMRINVKIIDQMNQELIFSTNDPFVHIILFHNNKRFFILYPLEYKTFPLYGFNAGNETFETEDMRKNNVSEKTLHERQELSNKFSSFFDNGQLKKTSISSIPSHIRSQELAKIREIEMENRIKNRGKIMKEKRRKTLEFKRITVDQTKSEDMRKNNILTLKIQYDRHLLDITRIEEENKALKAWKQLYDKKGGIDIESSNNGRKILLKENFSEANNEIWNNEDQELIRESSEIFRIKEKEKIEANFLKKEEDRKNEEIRIAEESRLLEEKRREIDRRILEKRQEAEAKRKLEEKNLAEERRKAEEIRLAIDKKIFEEKAAAEKLRKEQIELEEAKAKEEYKRLEEERRISAEKKLEEARKIYEEKKLAEEKRLSEEKRIADERRIEYERRVSEKKKFDEEKKIEEDKKLAEVQKLFAEKKALKEKKQEEERLKAEEAKIKELNETKILEELKLAEERRINSEKKQVQDRKNAIMKRKLQNGNRAVENDLNENFKLGEIKKGGEVVEFNRSEGEKIVTKFNKVIDSPNESFNKANPIETSREMNVEQHKPEFTKYLEEKSRENKRLEEKQLMEKKRQENERKLAEERKEIQEKLKQAEEHRKQVEQMLLEESNAGDLISDTENTSFCGGFYCTNCFRELKKGNYLLKCDLCCDRYLKGIQPSIVFTSIQTIAAKSCMNCTKKIVKGEQVTCICCFLQEKILKIRPTNCGACSRPDKCYWFDATLGETDEMLVCSFCDEKKNKGAIVSICSNCGDKICLICLRKNPYVSEGICSICHSRRQFTIG